LPHTIAPTIWHIDICQLPNLHSGPEILQNRAHPKAKNSPSFTPDYFLDHLPEIVLTPFFAKESTAEHITASNAPAVDKGDILELRYLKSMGS